MDTVELDLTEVTTLTTLVKVVNESTNQVETVTHYGKPTINQCKNKLKETHLTYVSKEVVKDTFTVPTKTLIELKKV